MTWRTFKEIQRHSYMQYQKIIFKRGLLNGKPVVEIVLYIKGTTLKKINFSFIDHFYLGKCSYRLDTFGRNLLGNVGFSLCRFWRRNFHNLVLRKTKKNKNQKTNRNHKLICKNYEISFSMDSRIRTICLLCVGLNKGFGWKFQVGYRRWQSPEDCRWLVIIPTKTRKPNRINVYIYSTLCHKKNLT